LNIVVGDVGSAVWDADAWAALGTWAAVVVALWASVAGLRQRSADRKIQRRVWGPALTMRCGSLSISLTMISQSLTAPKAEQRSHEDIERLRTELEAAAAWPSVQDIERIASAFPEAASQLGIAREHISVALEDLTFATTHYRGQADWPQRGKFAIEAAASLDDAHGHVTQALNAVDPPLLRWRLQERWYELVWKLRQRWYDPGGRD
jgi:PAS domain-containing protein